MKNFNHIHRARGSTTVELVFFAGFLILTLIAAADFGRLVHSLLSLESAMRAGLSAGVELCKDGINYKNKCMGTVPSDIMDKVLEITMKNISANGDPSYTFIANKDQLKVFCRCPEFDESDPGDTEPILCSIFDFASCLKKPETQLQMTASISLNVLFYRLDIYSKINDTPLEIELGPIGMAVY